MERKYGPAVLTFDARLKAKIAVLFLILAATAAFGSEFAAEIGMYPAARLEVETPSVMLLNYDRLMYADLSAKLNLFPWLYVSGATTVYFYPYSDKVSFFPFYASFLVGAGVQLGPVTVGYEHQCDHAVIPYSFVVDPILKQDAGYDKVFLRYTAKF